MYDVVFFSVNGGNGTLTAVVNSTAIASDDWIEYGKNIVFTAAPAPGYGVKEWTDNSSTVNGINVTVTKCTQ